MRLGRAGGGGALRAFATVLMLAGAVAVVVAIVAGPWVIDSFDAALDAHLLERGFLAGFGLVIGVVGWVLSGSNRVD